MNKANQLFDGQYIIKTYGKKILTRLPKFKKILVIETLEHKSLIWDVTYHIVVEYKITFLTKKDKEKKLSLFCSAHSDEPRKNVYESLKFLWKNGFNNLRGNQLTVPRPLFYSNYFKGTFYIGAGGKNLYHYVRTNNKKEIESIVPKAAAWFAKLHAVPISEAKNFSRDNSRIKTVRPGMSHIFERIKHQYPHLHDQYKKLYEETNNIEKSFLNSTSARWLIHGDAHPENIIRMPGKKIAAIDFTDLSLSDFARDLGSFIQQTEFKIMRRIGDQAYADKITKLFLDNYLENAKIEMTADLEKRIKNYYNWTKLRTIAFFLMKHHPKVDRAEQLLKTF